MSAAAAAHLLHHGLLLAVALGVLGWVVRGILRERARPADSRPPEPVET